MRGHSCAMAAEQALGFWPDGDVMTLKRYDTRMSLPKRATVYFEPEIHRHPD
jgi:hypothetical protein